VARKLQFAQAFQRDLGRPVCSAEICRFLITPNQWFLTGCPVSIRGAYRDRHERGTGCGGRGRRARRRCPTRTAKSCGPDAAVLASSLRGDIRAATVAKEPFTGESTK